MPELWGIDDPQELQRIERAVNARTRSYFRVFLYVGGSGLLAAGIGRFLAPHYPTLATLAVIIVFAFGLLVYLAGEFARYLRAKAEVLRSMGRCLNCGYKLEPSKRRSCPECGRSIDSVDAA
jgi:Flp pilus assembly protein TadB